MIPRYLYSQPPPHTLNHARPSFSFSFSSCCCYYYHSVYYIPWQGRRYSVSQRLRIVGMVCYHYLLAVVYEETTCKRHMTTVLTHASHDLSRTGQVITCSKWQSLLLSTRQCWQWKLHPRAIG